MSEKIARLIRKFARITTPESLGPERPGGIALTERTMLEAWKQGNHKERGKLTRQMKERIAKANPPKEAK